MAAMTLTEALAEIELINRHLALKRAFLLAVAVRPGILRDPLAGAGGIVALAMQEQQSLVALEEHRIALRRAIRVTAESVTITIGGQTRTISDWLEWRRKIAPDIREFLGSVRQQIQIARSQANSWTYGLLEAGGSARSIDIVVNLNEPELARQSEMVEEALGNLDGQLSLKSATQTIEIVSRTKFLTEREAQLVEWLKLLGQEAVLQTAAGKVRTYEYEIPDEYDAYAGYGMRVIPSELQHHVRGLLSGGRKIEAIKLVRERTGWTMIDARNAVEAL
jgi:hypothetical protein